MNYFLEITKLIEEFCTTTPIPDSCGAYLEMASKVNELRIEAICLAYTGVKSDDDRVIRIYKKLSKILVEG